MTSLHEGDWVLVNLAAFIGSWEHCRESVPCRVLTVDDTHVEVATEFPMREFSLQVLLCWIDGKVESSEAEKGANRTGRSFSSAGLYGALEEVVG